MSTPGTLFVGTKRHVVAIDIVTGRDLWRVRLPKVGWGAGPVALLITADIVFAGCGGYVFALDRQTGEILWRNDLTGLGHDYVVLATDGLDTDQARAQQALLAAIADAQARAAAAAAAAG